MKNSQDVVVIGAGQAGLAVSYLLTQARVQHLVLERGEIGDSWRTQRWDSFHLNTPNWANGLPGLAFCPEAPGLFSHRDQLISFFQHYARTFDLPVQQHAAVTALQKRASGGYTLQTEQGALHARAVVLASGAMSQPRVPSMARRLADDIISLSAGAYRSPAALPAGAVLVAGSGQSGCQIAEDLLEAGRRVYVCASRVARVPRVYRGRDILVWWRDMGFLEVRVEHLEDPAIQFAAQPQVSGTKGGHTVSLQSLARDGATLLGRVLDVDGGFLKVGSDLSECIRFADVKCQAFKAAIDAYIARQGIQAKAAAPDPGEPALPDLQASDLIDKFDLRQAGVTSVIWCTGFDADWSWVKVDAFDERGKPRHHAGITEDDGLYFVGLPWLAKRKSGIFYGVSEDARRIVQHMERHVLSSAAR